MTAFENFVYFTQHLSEYMKEHLGKFVVIAEGKEQGFFDTFDQAYCAAIKKFELGSFVIQECVRESNSASIFYSPLNG